MRVDLDVGAPLNSPSPTFKHAGTKAHVPIT